MAQLNYQFYDVLRRFDATFQLHSPYQTLDDAGFRLAARFRIDMEKPWRGRDGTTRVEVITVDGDSVQRIALGGGTSFNSVWISREPVNLAESPILDLRLRTTSTQPIRVLFQVPGNETWYGIDLIGTQAVGTVLDSIKAIQGVNDGKWHRVNWNLRQMIAEHISPEVTSINNLIIGTWVNAPEPAVIELRRVAFGIDNRLDGQER